MTGMVAGAVALTESGVLVHGAGGMTVTDLLSGFEVSGEVGDPAAAGNDMQTGSTAEPAVSYYRGSRVPLTRLEAVRELVEEALAERARDPELTSANPVVPRTTFPWGVGASHSDVLVGGPDAPVVASYLRTAGLRARTVDVDAALRIAGDLEIARLDLTPDAVPDPGTDEPDRVDEVDVGDTAGEDPELDEDGVAGRRRDRTLTVVMCSLLLVVGGIIATVVVRSGGAGGAASAGEVVAASTAPDASADAAPEQTPASPEPPAPPAESRAVTPVRVDVPGWQLTGSDERREIWESGDPAVRVLVAAVATPLTRQEDLDRRMLDKLGEVPDVRVISPGPVDYEESYPGSTTRWQVRLVDGHQVSVGCQYREFSAERIADCDRFTATARVG